MDEKISIILPVYNSETTIKETIESILNQSYNNFELLIINDGSKDNTLKICENFLPNDKIHIITIKNSGPSKARNVGIEKSTGSYIMFIDADDMYEEDMLKKMHSSIIEEKCDIVICNYSILSKNKTIKHENIKNMSYDDIYSCIEYMCNKRIFNIIWNKIYKASIIRDFGIKFNENIELGEDYCFNIDYFEKISSCYILCENLYIYRIMSNSVCTKYRENLFELKLNNVKHHKNMYERKGYITTTLSNKYIDCLKSAILTLTKNKNIKLDNKIKLIKKYIVIIKENINDMDKENLNKENRLVFKLMNYKNTILLYFYIIFKDMCKKIVCFLKKEQYR